MVSPDGDAHAGVHAKAHVLQAEAEGEAACRLPPGAAALAAGLPYQ